VAAALKPQTNLRHSPSTPIKSSLGVNAGDHLFQPEVGRVQAVVFQQYTLA
jgi:hypothetical protein